VRHPSFVAALVVVALTLGGCLGPQGPRVPAEPSGLALAGQFSIAPLGRFPPTIGLPFGGISGLARVSDHELLGISDAQKGGRIYRFRVDGVGPDFNVTIADYITLERAPGGVQPDHEGLVRLPNGHYLVSAEGTGREPRLPPSIEEYGPHGQFIRMLPLPDRFVPEPTGAVTRGARGNFGFESLTLSPDGRRLFTATETALIQDGEPATFESGTTSRILEYVARDGTFVPAREFAYPVERVDRVAYAPGLALNGVVELLALNDTTMLTLERAYVEDAAKTGASVNRVRVFRISLANATDISGFASIREPSGIRPVDKTLVADLSTLPGLGPGLATPLDNYEGLAFGPRLPDGRASIVLVSDDNFGAAQRTWFLLFAIQ
jgi:hypothetical protein